MKTVIVSFSDNPNFPSMCYDVDNTLTDPEITTLVNITFSKVPGEKTWVNA